MARATKPRKRRVDARRAMGATSVRMPAEFLTWLNAQAIMEDTTVGQIIRDCVASAIVRSGEAEEYGISLVSEDPPV